MKQTKLFGEEEPRVLISLELRKAQSLAEEIAQTIGVHCNRIEIVGSIRRKKPMVGDIDFVVNASDYNWSRILQLLKKSQVICAGNSLIKLNCPYGNSLFQTDFYRANEKTFGIQTLIRTGSADHNMWLAGYAISRGCRLKYSEGLLKGEAVVAGETEESVFSVLDLPTPKPEQREVRDGKPVWLEA